MNSALESNAATAVRQSGVNQSGYSRKEMEKKDRWWKEGQDRERKRQTLLKTILKFRDKKFTPAVRSLATALYGFVGGTDMKAVFFMDNHTVHGESIRGFYYKSKWKNEKGKYDAIPPATAEYLGDDGRESCKKHVYWDKGKGVFFIDSINEYLKNTVRWVEPDDFDIIGGLFGIKGGREVRLIKNYKQEQAKGKSFLPSISNEPNSPKMAWPLSKREGHKNLRKRKKSTANQKRKKSKRRKKPTANKKRKKSKRIKKPDRVLRQSAKRKKRKSRKR